MSIRVLVADDHAVFVAGIRSVLEKADDISIIGHAKDGQEAVEATLREKPDVLVVDISMPGVSGIEATRRIRSDLPSAKILCLTMHSAEPFLTAALEAGASGYMLKDCALEELTTAIRSVVAHGSYFSPAVASIALQSLLMQKNGSRGGTPLQRLTSRERETLQLIAEGTSTKRIAAKLGVSIKTVCTHRENLMEKLGIRSVAGLTKFAIRSGLTTVDADPLG